MKTKELKGISQDREFTILDGYSTSSYGSIKLSRGDKINDLYDKLCSRLNALGIEKFQARIESDNISSIIIIWQK